MKGNIFGVAEDDLGLIYRFNKYIQKLYLINGIIIYLMNKVTN